MQGFLCYDLFGGIALKNGAEDNHVCIKSKIMKINE